MVWVPPGFMWFGTGSGHGARPAYSVTPAGRGMVFMALPSTGSPPSRPLSFFELRRDFHFCSLGAQPGNVLMRTWLFECAEKLDYRTTGPLETYAKLENSIVNKPCEWWRERGAKHRD